MAVGDCEVGVPVALVLLGQSSFDRRVFLEGARDLEFDPDG